MTDMTNLYQTADWKKEKHVPAIDAPAKAKQGENIKVTVTVGKEIAHPNTTEHHIEWIELLFLPSGEKFPTSIGRACFNAHGASTQGPNTSTIFTNAEATFSFKTDKPGTLISASSCNIHGLWQSSKDIDVA